MIKPASSALLWFFSVAVLAACSDDCPELRRSDTIDLEAVPVATALSFVAPVDAVLAPGRLGVFFVVEQTGTVVEADLNNQTQRVVLDLQGTVASLQTNWELGLYSVALHPDFPTDPRVYVSFTGEPRVEEMAATSYVLELYAAADGTWSRQDERVLIAVDQPQPDHNGGTIRFLPDGRLGLALGDGGFGNEVMAHTPGSDFGRLLAFDIDAPMSPAPKEELAFGFRNPWKWFVDPQTDAVYVGDVGNLEREELNRVEAGGYYGWPRFEGTHENDDFSACETCGAPVFPVAEYCHSVGNAITAGLTYRGSEIPELAGMHLFADFSAGRLFVVDGNATRPQPLVSVGTTSANITAIIEDHDGEILALDRASGGFARVVPVDRSLDPPRLLSNSRFVAKDDPRSPPVDALAYSIQWPFFSDGAGKDRWVLPTGPAWADAEGDLIFPEGTALVKYFEIDGRPVETRILIHGQSGRWQGYSYRWQHDGRDAELLVGNSAAEFNGVSWYYPTRSECLACHTQVANIALGPTLSQLGSDGQLERWVSAGALEAQSGFVEALPNANDPSDGSLDERARAYLEVNCASCHQPGGPGGGGLDFRSSTPELETGMCNPPQIATLGLQNPRVVTPGDPDQSVLWLRLISLGDIRMHPFRQTRDREGEAIIRPWIESVACLGQ